MSTSSTAFQVVQLDDSNTPFRTLVEYDEPEKDGDGVPLTPEELAHRTAKAKGWEEEGRFAVRKIETTLLDVYGPDGREGTTRCSHTRATTFSAREPMTRLARCMLGKGHEGEHYFGKLLDETKSARR